MWLSLSTISLFWTPSWPTRVSLIITGALTAFDLILLIVVPQLFHRESFLTMLACFVALAVTGICLLSNRLIQAAKEEEVRVGHTSFGLYDTDVMASRREKSSRIAPRPSARLNDGPNISS